MNAVGAGAGGGGVATCTPAASKVMVLTSDSAPWAGISCPFQKKVTPAAFPTFTTISREAWTVELAGAISVSWRRVCPSAAIEIQEFSLARITSESAAFFCAFAAESDSGFCAC